MRDCFGLVDISAYMFGCGLLLPVVNLIGRDSPIATAFLLALVIPIPFTLHDSVFTFPTQSILGLRDMPMYSSSLV